MRIIFNPTGTHVKNGRLKIRVDLYPEPADRTYEHHYVDKFDREPTEEELADPAKLALVPTHQELNPCLCHFVTIDEGTTKGELEAFIEDTFTPELVKTLDDVLILPEAAHHVSPLMRSRVAVSTRRVSTPDIDVLNMRFAGLDLRRIAGNYNTEYLPDSIDIGPACIDRAKEFGSGWTGVNEENPANADGTIDTVEVWAYSGLSGFIFGTFYGGGPTWTCRDSELIGSVPSGSKQIFTGLSVDVATGDRDGNYQSGGDIEKDQSGSDGLWYVLGQYLDPSDSTTYALASGYGCSVYGTGTESGGGEAKTSAETGAGVDEVAGVAAVLDGGETGSGAESLGTRSFSLPDGGSGFEGLQGRALLVADSGQGGEYAYLPGMEVLFSGDDGRGSDSLKALTARTGSDTKLRPGYGRVGLPHKEVNL
jgi:hypothetical protein